MTDLQAEPIMVHKPEHQHWATVSDEILTGMRDWPTPHPHLGSWMPFAQAVAMLAHTQVQVSPQHSARSNRSD